MEYAKAKQKIRRSTTTQNSSIKISTKLNIMKQKLGLTTVAKKKVTYAKSFPLNSFFFFLVHS